jgi:anthranilate synthase component 1
LKSDYHGGDNGFLYFQSIASIKIEKMKLFLKLFDMALPKGAIAVTTDIQRYPRFSLPLARKNDFKFINNGLFGYISYDAVPVF